METTIAMTVFGILICAYPADGDNCAQELAMDDFDAAQFFNGTWYFGHHGSTDPTVCQKFTTKETKGVTYFVESGYKKFGACEKFHCDGGKKNEEKYSFKCSSNDCGNKNINFEVDFTAISVEYDDFALICRSIQFESGSKEDELMVLWRTKDHLTDKNVCEENT